MSDLTLGPFAIPAFRRFWLAATVSAFGSAVTGVALPVLVVNTLHGTASDLGLVNAARWLPYPLLGPGIGVLVDRGRRRALLVGCDLLRAAMLVLVPLVFAFGRLDIPRLAALMVGFGVLSIVADAASQSLLPRTVPRDLITAANARLDQSDSVAQTSGPVLGGVLVAVLGAPLAVLVDGASYLVSGAIAAAVVEEPASVRKKLGIKQFCAELAEGVRWIYRHRTLAPLALSTHVWFIFSGMVGATLAPFALRGVGLTAFGFGTVLATAGVGGVLGSSMAVRLGARWGAGMVILAARLVQAASVGLLALAPAGQPGQVAWAGACVLGIAQFGWGLALGAENANEMGYWQAVTPDRLQGRMSATRRSLNRAMLVVGAPLGGWLADAAGYRPALLVAAAGIALATVALAVTLLRDARMPDESR